MLHSGSEARYNHFSGRAHTPSGNKTQLLNSPQSCNEKHMQTISGGADEVVMDNPKLFTEEAVPRK